jgi:hypothetical protein
MRDGTGQTAPEAIVMISTTPVTQPKSVVLRVEKPHDLMMMAFWLVRELGTLSRAEKRAKSQVLGSTRASMNCSFFHLCRSESTTSEREVISTRRRKRKRPGQDRRRGGEAYVLFSTPERFERIRSMATIFSRSVRKRAVMGLSGKQKRNQRPTT